jgi:hypothetical protein
MPGLHTSRTWAYECLKYESVHEILAAFPGAVEKHFGIAANISGDEFVP